MPISEAEKNGLSELLLSEENSTTLIKLAKRIIENVTTVSNSQEALALVITHGNDAASILNKKLITKEILFKYLNARNISIESNITKAALVIKTLEHWQASQKGQQTCDNPPVDEIAKAFAEWFFNKYNAREMVLEDFYPDADMKLGIQANDGLEEYSCHDALSITTLLAEKNCQFGFHFNLNTTEMGIQGRLDIHGMLLVLTCGTIHTEVTCVGVFEVLFGLLRDPFGQNAWKIKTIRALWRSQEASSMPTLEESESLKGVLVATHPNCS